VPLLSTAFSGVWAFFVLALPPPWAALSAVDAVAVSSPPPPTLMICGAGAEAIELPLSPDCPIITPTPIASTSVATPAIKEAFAVIRERR